MEIGDCILKIFDADGVEHSVKVRAESVYEATLKGFERFDRLSLAKDDSSLIVEVYELAYRIYNLTRIAFDNTAVSH